jgi:hypothetical protein
VQLVLQWGHALGGPGFDWGWGQWDEVGLSPVLAAAFHGQPQCLRPLAAGLAKQRGQGEQSNGDAATAVAQGMLPGSSVLDAAASAPSGEAAPPASPATELAGSWALAQGAQSASPRQWPAAAVGCGPPRLSTSKNPLGRGGAASNKAAALSAAVQAAWGAAVQQVGAVLPSALAPTASLRLAGGNGKWGPELADSGDAATSHPPVPAASGHSWRSRGPLGLQRGGLVTAVVTAVASVMVSKGWALDAMVVLAYSTLYSLSWGMREGACSQGPPRLQLKVQVRGVQQLELKAAMGHGYSHCWVAQLLALLGRTAARTAGLHSCSHCWVAQLLALLGCTAARTAGLHSCSHCWAAQLLALLGCTAARTAGLYVHIHVHTQRK